MSDVSKSGGPRGAILQRDKKTYAIVPRTPVGLVTPDVLDKISEVVKKYKVPIIKITSGQRMALVGIEAGDVDHIWLELGMEVGPAKGLCVHYVQACPGTSVCKFGLQDSLSLGLELEKSFVGMDLPSKLKMGVSGCMMCCGESFVRDVGVIGKKNGWSLVFGGNSGGRPRVGDLVAEGLDKERLTGLIGRCLEYYRDNAKARERTARFMERVGIDALRQAVL